MPRQEVGSFTGEQGVGNLPFTVSLANGCWGKVDDQGNFRVRGVGGPAVVRNSREDAIKNISIAGEPKELINGEIYLTDQCEWHHICGGADERIESKYRA